MLFILLDDKKVIDAGIYNKAGIDHQHFSKIRSNPDYHPSKKSVVALALALALQLNKKEADSLLGAAGYALSESVIHLTL